MKKKFSLLLALLLALSLFPTVQAVSKPDSNTSGYVEQLSYADISANDSFHYAVAGLERNNIRIGKSSNSFSPADIVNRADFISMLYQFENVPTLRQATLHLTMSA